MLCDVHAHIYSSIYNNIDDVLVRAKESGVKKIINCAEDIASSKEVVLLSSVYKGFLYSAVGCHPQNVEGFNLIELEDIISNNKVAAIGEIGLDYHYDQCNKDLQKKVFIDQLDLAMRYNLPVIIHSRDAFKDTIDILKHYNLKGVIHCFSGSLECAKEYIKLGYLLGIGGVVTFKNSKLKEYIKEIGLDNIVLETDSPFLAPEPYRGRENEPSYIVKTLEYVSNLFNISSDELISRTYSNIGTCFDLN
ncbi:MAG: TatD family hydrolase [Bacilli bacterium]